MYATHGVQVGFHAHTYVGTDPCYTLLAAWAIVNHKTGKRTPPRLLRPTSALTSKLQRNLSFLCGLGRMASNWKGLNFLF